jgi:hypothetical protein
MSADLLIAYTRSGGAPPATLESLRVHADGSARAIVTNAWPDGAPQDEAGLYETRLGDDVVAGLRALAADRELLALPAELGEVRADSGQTSLSLAGERKTWGAFAEPPAPLQAAERRLRALLAEVRRHPRAAVRLELAARGGGELELAVTSTGSEPVRSSLLVAGGPAPRVARVDGDLPRPVPLRLYREAAELELAETLDGEPLAAGETRRVVARAPEGAGALLAFAPLTIELPANGDLVALDGFLVAGPA